MSLQSWLALADPANQEVEAEEQAFCMLTDIQKFS